jgi:phosphatidylglycerophosphatase A
VLIALGFVRGHLAYEALAWVGFRFFDITKPGPIDRVQYLSPPGLGIMADDILAGLVSGGLAALLLAFFGGF